MKIALTVNEVAEMLGLSKDIVYRLAREGTLPSVKAGSRVLFHRPSIEKWLAGGN